MNKRKIYKSILEQEKYRSTKLEEVFRFFSENPNLLDFSDKVWKGIKANSYAYALNIPIDDSKKLFWVPGKISSSKISGELKDDLLTLVKKDLDCLGIKYRENSETLCDGEWRIAIYSYLNSDKKLAGYRFFRQNPNNTWAEKKSWFRYECIKSYVHHDTPVYCNNHDGYYIQFNGILVLRK